MKLYKPVITWAIILLYIILIGYKRIMLFAWAFFPLWYSVMGLDRLPNGQVTDNFAHDNMIILFIVGLIWFPFCLFIGLIFENWLNIKYNKHAA